MGMAGARIGIRDEGPRGSGIRRETPGTGVFRSLLGLHCAGWSSGEVF